MNKARLSRQGVPTYGTIRNVIIRIVIMFVLLLAIAAIAGYFIKKVPEESPVRQQIQQKMAPPPTNIYEDKEK